MSPIINPFRVVVFFLMTVSGIATSQVPSHSISPGTLKELLEQHVVSAAPQKLFLHLDNTSYAAGETVWFKGYIVDGVTHLPDTATANVYVELWDVQGEEVVGLVLRPESGLFHGDIELAGDLADGNYRLRAYTDWMRNQGEAYFFQQYLYISNPDFANVIDNPTRRFNRNFNQTLDRLQRDAVVGFYPEGGDLVVGLTSRMAVKVTDGTGAGMEADGEILNQAGEQIASFATNELGFGEFDMIPSAGSEYRALVRVAGQQVSEQVLPAAMGQGVVMRVDVVDEQWLEVQLAASQEDTGTQHVTILGHTRGKPVVFETGLSLNGVTTKRYPLRDFPTGIAHITVFSAEALPLAERLVFINHHDQVYFDMRARTLRAGETTALHIDILATEEDGTPVKGDFSVAVQFSPEIQRTYLENIFSYLFLSGDLKGLVADPAWYFDFTKDDVEEAIDLLLLTHGWRRFDWNRLTDSGPGDPPYAPRFGITIEGSATDPHSEMALRDANLVLRPVKDRDISFSARTNQHGAFRFDHVQLTDSLLVEVVADHDGVIMTPAIEVEEIHGGMAEELDELTPNHLTKPQQVTERGRNWRRVRSERQPAARSGAPSAYGQADQVIYPDDNVYYPSMLDLLRDKSVGLSITPAGTITVRGPSSIHYQASPIFIVDGVESPGGFMGLDVREVERVEIFRGGSSAVFGARGVNGALVAYTKKRDFADTPTTSNMFMLRGIHAPRNFITDTEIAMPAVMPNRTITLHWEPGFTTGEDGLGSFQFLPHPTSGQYRIVIQGVGNNGKVGFGAFFIEI